MHSVTMSQCSKAYFYLPASNGNQGLAGDLLLRNRAASNTTPVHVYNTPVRYWQYQHYTKVHQFSANYTHYTTLVMHIHHNTRPVAVPVIQHPPNSLASATNGGQISQPQPSPQPLNSTKFKQQENGELEESRLFQFIYSNCRQNYLPGNLKLVLSTKACKA